MNIFKNIQWYLKMSANLREFLQNETCRIYWKERNYDFTYQYEKFKTVIIILMRLYRPTYYYNVCLG